jgi:GTP-binding protein EngB required for normal cell division
MAMFKQQECILSSLPDVRALFLKYQRPVIRLDSIEKTASHFSVRVPLVGAFSSGKSSLLNSLIGERLFATSIDPQTAVPAELNYAENARFTGCHADGQCEVLSHADIADNHLNQLVEGGWIEVELPAKELACLPHLKLVDMPGWDSGNDRHAAAIDNYAARSLAYCVVVSAEEGTLHESIRAALTELKLSAMPVIAIISKCDKLTAESIDAIAGQVRQEVEKVMGKPPLCIARVSARQNNLGEFIAALATLEQQSEGLFGKTVGHEYRIELDQLQKYLSTLLNSEDLDSAQITVKRQAITQEMRDFQTRLDEETLSLDNKLPKVIASIVEQIESELNRQLDSLTDLALRNGALRPPIEHLIRTVVTRWIKEEFQDELQYYFDKVGEALPKDIQLNLPLPDLPDIQVDSSDDSGFDTIKTVVTGALAAMLLEAPMVAAIVIPLAHMLIDMFRSDSGKELAEAKRRETACQHLQHTVFPQVVQATESALRPKLQARVQQVKASIAKTVQAQVDAAQAALSELDAQLAHGKAAFEQQCRQYQADLLGLQILCTQIESQND